MRFGSGKSGCSDDILKKRSHASLAVFDNRSLLHGKEVFLLDVGGSALRAFEMV